MGIFRLCSEDIVHIWMLENYSHLFFVGKDALLIECLIHPLHYLFCIYVNSLFCLKAPRNEGYSGYQQNPIMVLSLPFSFVFSGSVTSVTF